MSDSESDVSRVLAKVGLVSRAFGPNRGLLIIVLAILSANRRPQIAGLLLAVLSVGIAVWKYF